MSSARVVRCWVKSRNERNPYRMLPAGKAGHSCETAGDKPEEGGDDVKSSCPLCPGRHTCYNGRDAHFFVHTASSACAKKWVSNKANRNREVEETAKGSRSSDRRLKPACVKPELLVIADQHAAVNTFPGLVHTARHTMGAGNTRSRCANS